MKTLVLERHINSRVHRTIISADVPLHIDIVEALWERWLKRNISADIDTIIDTVIERR